MYTNIYQKPTVTVLLPVFNGSKFLLKAINSILHQTYKNFEFLIIDDFSTDNSLEIINSILDYRLRIITNKTNIGLTKTLNKGLQLANGQYIARIDQDDTSVKDRLQKQMHYLEKIKSIKLIGSWCKIIDENDQFIKSIHFPCDREEILEAFVSYNPFIHSSVVFDKNVAINLGGYPKSFVHAQDFYLWYKITSKFQSKNISDELVNIRWHKQRATNSKFNSNYIRKESVYVYRLALKNPEIKFIVKLKGKIRLILRPWFFRKIFGFKAK
jgi:glycosyltransferase involved in cell wall biosynthesis